MANVAKKKGLDQTLMMGIGAVILLVAVVILFRIWAGNKCPDVLDFTWTGELKTGNAIQFSDVSENAETWKWDFGDGSPVETTRNPVHTFASAQTFLVSLYVNGKCEVSKELKILQSVQETIEVPDLLVPVIEGPTEATAGEKLQFNCPTPGAKNYEWQFGETMTVDATNQSPVYTYNRKGNYKVTLIINGKSEQASHIITVKPKPVVNGGSARPVISSAKFISLLKDIADRKAFPEALNKYFCDDLTIPVTRPDGKETTLLSYCNAIRKIGLDAKSASFTVDKESGCIHTVKLN